MEFKAKLRQLREAHGLSQEDLAARLKVSQQAVSKWEGGAALPTIENGRMLAKIYRMTSKEEQDMFGFLKKKKKEESSMTKDEKQIEEAKEEIAEKGPDSQSETDRIDESVGEQEHLDGNEDSESAKERVEESEKTEEADEERAEEAKEAAPKDDAVSEKIVSLINSAVESAVSKAVAAAMAKALDTMGKSPEAAEPSEAAGLEGIYGE